LTKPWVKRSFSCLRATSAILASFVVNSVPPLGVGIVSLTRAIPCYGLPSTGVTRFPQYYAVIRLPASCLAS